MTMKEKNSLKERIITALFSRFPSLAEEWAKGFKVVRTEDIPWTPFAAKLSECRVAMVTTAGVHLKNQDPFDMVDEEGDYTYREIPGKAKNEDLTITHKYYDHRDADKDINIIYPIDRLREMAAAGEIGSVAATHFGFMGHIVGSKIESLLSKVAPEVANKLISDEVDLVLLTPG